MQTRQQTLKDNLQHIAGRLIGATVLRVTGTRYSKADRGGKWFSTVAANLAADGIAQQWFPYGGAK